MKKRLLCFLLVFAAALFISGSPARQAGAAGNREQSPKVSLKTLDNGLTVAVMENHAAPLVAVYAYIKNTGSIHEGSYTGSGISHYVEHIVAGGTTTTRTAEEAYRIIQKIGAQDNAYAAKAVTCYHMTVLSRWFDVAVDLLSDWIMNCAFDKAEVSGERTVVLKEIDKDEEEPETVLYNAFMEHMFRVHSSRYPIIGYRENVARLTREDLIKFYREKYVPDNVVFVVAGDIESEKAFSTVNNAFKAFKRKPVVHAGRPDEPPQVSTRFFQKPMPVNVVRMMMGYHTVGLPHQDLYPLDLAAAILGQGRTARLLKEVVYEKRLATDISVYSDTPFTGDGAFLAGADLAQGVAIEQAAEAIAEAIESLKNDLVAEDELARAKARKRSDFVYDHLDVEDQAETIGWDLIATGDPEFSRHHLEKIQKVTREDLRRAARKYFNRENLTVGVLHAPKPAAVQETQKKNPSQPLEIKRIQLDNGIRLLVQENRSNPSVAIQAYFQGGLRFSTRENAGVFPLLSRLLLRGTQNRSADQLAAEIEDLGGTISAFSGDDAFGINLDLVSGSEEKGLEILADIILNPAFNQAELETEKNILKEKIKGREDDWIREVYDLYRSTFFKTHPYGLPPKGTVRTAGELSLADVLDTYRKFCVSDNLVLAVFGSVDLKQLTAKVVEKFSAMEKKKFEVTPPARENPPAKKRVYTRAVEKKQIALCLGFAGVDIRSEDRYTLDVIDALTSGIRSRGGWLYNALRGGETSYVYLIHAESWVGVDAGSFYVLTQCSPEQKDRVVEIIYNVFKRLAAGKIDGQELAAAKEACITADRVVHQTNRKRAYRALHDELVGLGFDDHQRYEENIRKVSLEDVKKAAETYFKGPAVEVWTHPRAFP